MKKYYIIYAHGKNFDSGWITLHQQMIGLASTQTEIDTIISNFRKEKQVHDYYIGYFTDKKKNIVCSTKEFDNKYLK